jgi:hypothetical protein
LATSGSLTDDPVSDLGPVALAAAVADTGF